MSPFELRLAVQARGLEREADLELSAVHAAWTMAPHLKTPTSADELLGRHTISMEQFATIGEALEYQRKLHGVDDE